MKKSKKAPKIKKRIPGYLEGGTTARLGVSDPNYLNDPMRKSKGALDNFVSNVQNVGVGILDAGLGIAGANDVVDDLYSKNRAAAGSKKFGNFLGDATEQVAPIAAGLIGGPGASLAVKGAQILGNQFDGEEDQQMANGGETKGKKKKIYPTKQDAKTYLENSTYIDQARALLNAEIATRLNLKEGQPIPDDAILTNKEVGDVLKGTGYDAYYDKVKWMSDYYNKYRSASSGVAGDKEFGQGKAAPIESTAYGAKHRAAKYAKLKPLEESDIINIKTVTDKAPAGPAQTIEDAFGIINGKKEGGLTSAKAKEILRDGTIRGNTITDKQKRYFGFVAGQEKSDGGNIKGPGTAKSDSIKAKIEPGSFVVPAENAHIAERISEMYLGKEGNKANLNQGGGAPVKLSNQEFLFTPDEVAKLIDMNIDVTKLAPNANKGNGKSKGGKVKWYQTGGEVQELDQLLKNIEADIKNAKTAKEAAELQKRQTRLSEYRTLIASEADAIRKYASGDRSEDVLATLGEVPEGEDPLSYYQQTYASNVADYRKDAGATSATKIKVAPSVRSARTSAPSLSTERIPMTEMQSIDAGELVSGTPSPTVQGRTVASGIPTDTSQLPAPKNPGFDLSGVGINAEDLISGAQIAVGAGSLLSDGKRPVDSLSDEYLDTINQAKTNATYGYDPATLAGYERDIEGARVTGVNLASQLAGGDAGKALANARAFTNQYAGNMLDLRASDNQLRLQKQRYRDSLISNKVEKERRLFEDKLNAFNTNQQSGAGLLSSGISSLQNAQKNKRIEDLISGLSSTSNDAFVNSLINF